MAYLRDKFIKYLTTQGNYSPGAYCNSLNNIEKIFNVDIDSEYEKDKCDALYKHIQQVRKNPERIGKKEHDVRQFASNLNKYIKFRNSNEASDFNWIPFYEELADKLLEYKSKRKELLEIIKKCYEAMPIKYPLLEKGETDYSDVDPFTVFGTFNRGLKDQTRVDILKHYKNAFGVKADVPTKFEGIPVLMNMSAWFFAYKENRGDNDIDNLWELFEAALNYADHNTDRDRFIFYYDQVLTQKQVKWNITMGLFWIRPNTFLSLDSVNREYIKKYNEKMLPPVTIGVSEIIECEKNGRVVSAKEYFEINRSVNDAFCEHSYKGISKELDIVNSIPLLSYDAWLLSQEGDSFDDSKCEVKEEKQENIYRFLEYSKEDFLKDVFMTSDEYDELVALLEHKKNLILQGAPGVGKSYAAKRLAYSIIGKIDDEKVQMVQFHQSYSYEDFIAGFRPNDNGGFYIQDGPFYSFCKNAESDFDNKYFFIIDEINRGNLSKIFGELMLLLESDKRGKAHSINLLYKNEQFSVPENVFIIGMMNTADRSLAMIDYALRRRFVFYTMEPAFEKDIFKAFTADYSAKAFDKVIDMIIALNADISSDIALGKGFRIGHSYFCSNDIDDNKLAGIVKYEIIPQLYEYWFDDEAKAKDWESKLLGAIND